MHMWEGFHHEGTIPVLISVEYDEDLNKYIVEVTRGLERRYRTFTPKQKPEEGNMFVGDLEKSVKLSNGLLKGLQITARRGK